MEDGISFLMNNYGLRTKGGYTMNLFNYSKAKLNEIFADVKVLFYD